MISTENATGRATSARADRTIALLFSVDAALGQVPADVLHDHDRSIYDHPHGEGEASEAHQVRGDVHGTHEQEGEEEGDRER